jgi:hypothetical protein
MILQKWLCKSLTVMLFCDFTSVVEVTQCGLLYPLVDVRVMDAHETEPTKERSLPVFRCSLSPEATCKMNFTF